MIKFMFMIRRRELLLWLFIVVWFLPYLQAGPSVAGQSVPIKAFGTGMTTGHIADLVVKNKSNTAIQIRPQRVFIPSSGQYQPYIADIPSATIPPGHTDTIHLQGYCTDVHLGAAPAAFELIPILKWIPIRQPDSTLVGNGLYLITHNSVVPFTKDHISYIITSAAYTPLYPAPDSLNIVNWPGTEIPVGGKINHVSRPDLYATVMAKVLELLEIGSVAVQLSKTISTPFTVDSIKEREAIIQQIIWMYASALAGKKYGKEEFSTRVYEQFKSRSALTDIPALEKQELDEGINEFWNIFLTVVTETRLFTSKDQLTVNGAMVDLPIDTIQYPWSVISMTDIIMKPGFVKYIPLKVSNPSIPIIAGALSVGSLLFIAFHENDKDSACVFTLTLQTTPSACSQANGTVLLSTDIEAEYTYIWSNGATTKNLVGVPTGNYSVTVTRNSTTCAQNAQAEVENVDLPIVATLTATDAHCGGQDGTASVSVEPPGQYSYLWSNGSTNQNQTNLAAGPYSVTVTASGTCGDTTDITINDLPATFSVDITNTPAHCKDADGTATVSVSPAGNYLYQWSDGSTTATVSGLGAGSYNVTVTESVTGCTMVAQTEVDALPPAFTIQATITDATCGASDGTASATVDPPGEYEYAWSNGQTSADVTDLAPGMYTVLVTMLGTTCSDSISITIGQLSPAYMINTSNTPASCGHDDGTATVTVDPPGLYEFNWSNGNSGAQLTDLAAGTYMVTVSLPGNACAQTVEVVVAQLPPPFTLSSSSTPVSCGLQDGTATVVVDPAGAYNYLWSSGQTISQVTELPAGTYEVTVSIPGSSCQQSISITIDQLPPPFTINLSSTAAHCGLDDGTATVLADPPGEYNYSWSNGQMTSQATGLMAAIYAVTISIPGTSCQQIMSVTIDQEPASFTVNTSSTPAHCGANDGAALATVDPPGAYMYQWSGGQTDATITGLPTGQYTVSVSLVGSSCFVIDTITVDQIPLVWNASFNVTQADCGVMNGSAVVTLDPAGSYTYIWSNQQTGNTLQQVPAGDYDVTVTDVNTCTASFSTSVGENPAHYLDILSISQASCIGGGEISFTLSGPDGQFNVDINTPGGPVSIILSPGSYILSSFMNVFAGTYGFTVFDQGIGAGCSDNQSVQVDEQTPAISTVTDVYNTPSEQAVNGNVLQNDAGLNLQLTSVTNIVGGAANFTSDGNFTYTPNTGFSGAGSFTYTVTDACGNTATGTALIMVQMVNCTITINSTLTPANCDLSNGSIAVSVNEPGSYQFTWSNGQNGSTILNIPAGSYTVTIQDTGTGCSEDFTINLTEYPANYISNIVITQPTCAHPGEIMFTLNTQGSAPFLSVAVDHPNGIQTFTIEPGVVVLSDYINIVEGSYAIEVFIGDAGPNCIDDFSVNINAAPAVVIAAGPITPPSSQGAMDGMVQIMVTDPGVTPYTIFVNNAFHGTTSSSTFQVSGLATGFYDVQIVDATGCMSNVLMVIIPLPNIVLSLGVALINTPITSVKDQPGPALPNSWHLASMGSMHYRLGKREQLVRMIYSPAHYNFHFSYSTWWQVEHLSEIISLHQKHYSFSINGGIGAQHAVSPIEIDPFYFSINANTGYTVGKLLHLQADMSMKGWSTIDSPQWIISATIPFLTLSNQ